MRAITWYATGPDGSVAIATPTVQFRLSTSSGGFTQGGDPVTVTISITDGYVLETAQTFTLEWLGEGVKHGHFMDPTNPQTIILPAGQIHASVQLRARNTASPGYTNTIRQQDLMAKIGSKVVAKTPLTLYDSDPEPTLTLSTSRTWVNEGDSFTLTATLSATSDTAVPVFLGITNPSGRSLGGLATLPYTNAPQGMYVNSGQATKSYVISTADTPAKDGDNKLTFIISKALSTDSRYSTVNREFQFGQTTVEVTIRDVTPANTPTIRAVGTAVEESGDPDKNAKLNFGVLLSRPVNQTVTVDYRTADGGAIAGTDYIAKTGTLTFAPNEVRKDVIIDILEDGIERPPREVPLVAREPDRRCGAHPVQLGHRHDLRRKAHPGRTRRVSLRDRRRNRLEHELQGRPAERRR